MALDTPISPEALAPVLKSLMSKAKAHGADDADAVATHGRSLSVSVRGGELEDVDNSEGKDVGLRVFVGNRQACVSSSDISDKSLDALAERAVAMAKLAPEDPYCGLAPHNILETAPANLDLFDSTVLEPEALKARAQQADNAARSVPGVAQTEGASSSASTSAIYFVTSNGFEAGWRSSRHGVGVSAIAAKDGAMERDYEFQGSRWFEDLVTPEHVGKTAGERAAGRLGSKQITSGATPIIFDQRVSGSLVSALINAIGGPTIARGISFLKDSLGEAVFGNHINIIDNPLMKRGHGSRPWDGEGVKVAKRHLIENGELKTWLLNTSAAKQLGLETTGHAYRGIGAPPGVSATNTYLAAGSQTPAELMAEMGDGFLITEMFGPSLNANTGDYSVGVAGFKIENGERVFPVSEVTVAGNLIHMYKNLTPANDLIFDGSIVAPSLRIEGMTLAGL